MKPSLILATSLLGLAAIGAQAQDSVGIASPVEAPAESTPPPTTPSAPADTTPTSSVPAMAVPDTTPVLAASAPPTTPQVATDNKRFSKTWFEEHTHGSKLYALPHVEVGLSNGFRGSGVSYRDRGGFMAEALLSAAATEGNRQAAENQAIQSGRSTYTYQQVSVSSPSIGLQFFSFNYEGKDSTQIDNEGMYLEFFYSMPFLEDKLGLPIVFDLGGALVSGDKGGMALSLTTFVPITRWAQGEINYRYGGMDNLDLSVVGNLTDALFARFTYAIMDDFAHDGSIQTTFGFRL